jgi:hypothetical protein
MGAESEVWDLSAPAMDHANAKYPEHSAVDLGSGWMALIYRLALAADDARRVRNEANSISAGFCNSREMASQTRTSRS